TDATTDALKKSGLSVQPGGKTLTATIKEYWMDGFGGYAGVIVTEYKLQDRSGATLWTAEVKGGGGGSTAWNNPTERIFKECLSDLAAHATEAFNSLPFREAFAK